MKNIFLLILSFAITQATVACDICGCGAGNSYIGILPEYNKNLAGFRYRYNSILSHVGVGGANTYLTTSEQYRTVELWGAWSITKNIRVMATIPYNFNERENQGNVKTKDGIGDIAATAFYQLVNKRKPVFSNKLMVQSLWAGFGIKAPTGQYAPNDKNAADQTANLFQLGTGSTDFILSAMYDLRVQDAGVNISTNYKMNTTNKHHYSYGNKFSASTQLYYKVKLSKNVTVAPSAGIQYERAARDLDHNTVADVSGGSLLLGTIGMEGSAGNFGIGCNWQTPFSQHLANGIVKAQNRMMVHIAYKL